MIKFVAAAAVVVASVAGLAPVATGVAAASPSGGAATRLVAADDRPGNYHPGLGYDNEGVVGQVHTVETRLVRARNDGESRNVRDLEVYTKNNQSIINYFNGDDPRAWIYSGNVWEGSRHTSKTGVETHRFISKGDPTVDGRKAVVLKMKVWEGDWGNGDDYLGEINTEIPADGIWRYVETSGGEGRDYAGFEVRVR